MNRKLFLSFLLLALGLNSSSTISSPQTTSTNPPVRKAVDCATLDMDYPDPFDEKAPLKFEVHIKGVEPNQKLKYSWFTSKGYVKSGQGTTSIVVVAEGADRQGLTATVVICGLPYECENEISRTTSIAE
jgi:hypothetical protein